MVDVPSREEFNELTSRVDKIEEGMSALAQTIELLKPLVKQLNDLLNPASS